MHEYSYAKDDFRHASLIAELTVQLRFTQARLRAPSWQAMRCHGDGQTRPRVCYMRAVTGRSRHRLHRPGAAS
jgi:hypothetical protein